MEMAFPRVPLEISLGSGAIVMTTPFCLPELENNSTAGDTRKTTLFFSKRQAFIQSKLLNFGFWGMCC